MSRNQTPITPQTPLSFKTVPGRHRTQKWSKAPTYNYEGDDWGGYDEYDEYGAQAQESVPPVPSQTPHTAQQPITSRGRLNSFDRGDDQSDVPAPSSSLAFPPYDPSAPRVSSNVGQPTSASSVGRGSNDFPRINTGLRDFTNPEQAPPPLATKAAPTPHEWFPPRKSSLSGGSYETASAAAEAKAIAESVAASAATTETDKPLPFIRPSDIYKRIPEELRRQSEEGNRPSLDSVQSQPASSQPVLTPVAEARESQLLMGDDLAKVQKSLIQTDSPSVPGQPSSLQTQGFIDRTVAGANGGQQEHKYARSSGDREITPTSSAVVTDGAVDSQNSLSSMQNTPTLTRAPPGHDPAGEILAERQHDVPVNAIANSNADGLQHQPSQGFRSVVHHAFDHSDPSLSRDNSLSTSGAGVSRSNTSSTAGISPIMSRVPSVPRHAQRTEEQVPSIAEENPTTPTGMGASSASHATYRIARKPSPSGHGRTVSSEIATPPDVEPGYRRSLDPPSSGESPARTPAVETVTGRRLSTPLSALPVTEGEPPDVLDQAAEVPQPLLRSAEADDSQVGDLHRAEYPFKPLPNPGRGRSGTDYSIREADMADTVNAARNDGPASPSIAEAQRTNQNFFLETHATISSPLTQAEGGEQSSRAAIAAQDGRSGSPGKGRVREIANSFHELDKSSRRNSAASATSSKSSWSQFGDAPRIKRQGTSQSQLANETAVQNDGTSLDPSRPELPREESFKPDVPGGWISAAPTPSIESPPQSIERDEGGAAAIGPSSYIDPNLQMADRNETVDLSPTTKKYQLGEGPGSAATTSLFDTLKNVGTELGAAMVSTVGVGHQTRDFASSEPAAPVDQPETYFRAPTGEVLVVPPLVREDTGSTGAPASMASSIAPTPPAKDTPRGDTLGVGGSDEYFNAVAPLRVRSREASPEHSQPSKPVRSLPTFEAGRASGEFESDRLGDEIVRSLGSGAGSHIAESTARTQDALDAPDNAVRAEQGLAAYPPVEAKASSPGLLNTRFSWENGLHDQNLPKTPEPQPSIQPPSPEIKPEAAYERPRSSVLHVVNTEVDLESPVESSAPMAVPTSDIGESLAPPLAAYTNSSVPVSPISKTNELQLPGSSLHPESPSQSSKDGVPSPVSDFDSRLPSYYLGDHSVNVADFSGESQTIASSLAPPVKPVEEPKPSGSIPPFKQILAMKRSQERIQAYNDTRLTFATMNTGLDNWLSKMVQQRPELADMAARPPLLTTTSSGLGTFKRGHKASPSIAKFTNKFSPSDGQRTSSTAGVPTIDEGSSARPSTQGGESSRVDKDKMQARGKEFMKSAGVFGGKASAGAKGLFAKGKSRFGSGSVRKSSNEVPSPMHTPSSPPIARPLHFATSVLPVQNEGEHALSAPEIPIETKPTAGVLAPPASEPPVANISPIPAPREESASPFRQPRSQTPSSTRTGGGRPMSQVFERLIEKGRSLSRSSTRSDGVSSQDKVGRSRPASWAVSNSDLVAAQTESAALADFSDVAVASSGPEYQRQAPASTMGVRSSERRMESWEDPQEEQQASTPTATSTTTTTIVHSPTVTTTTRVGRVMSMASPVRTESWNLPSAQLPPKTPDHQRSGTPGRLGILPSPAPTAGASHEYGNRRASQEVAHRRGSAAPFFNRGSADTFGEHLEPAGNEANRQQASFLIDDSEEDAVPLTGTVRRYKIVNSGLPSPVETTGRVLGEGSTNEPSKNGQPKPARQSGDLVGLPNLQLTVGSAPSAGQAEKQEQVESPIDPGQPSRLVDLPTYQQAGDFAVVRATPNVANNTILAKSAPIQNDPTRSESNQSVTNEAQFKPISSAPSDVRTGMATLERQVSPLEAESAHSNSQPEGLAGKRVAVEIGADQARSGAASATPPSQRHRGNFEPLPSQQRQSRSSVVQPESAVLADATVSMNKGVSASSSLDNMSPVTVMQASPLVSGRESSTEEEEDLYESTPTAAKKMWSGYSHANSPIRPNIDRAITGHEEEIAKMEKEIAEAAASAGASPVKPGAVDVSTPAAADENANDTASEVSADGGAQVPLQKVKTTDTDASRRSSVSSLDAHEEVTVDSAEPTLQRYSLPENPIMTSQAMPAGPTGTPQTQRAPPIPHVEGSRSASQSRLSAGPRESMQRPAPPRIQTEISGNDGTDQHQRFAQRPYRPNMAERPLSYMPLPRDAAGLPLPETLTTGSGQGSEALQSTNRPNQSPRSPRSPRNLPLPAPSVDLSQVVSPPSKGQKRQSEVFDVSGMSGPPPGAPPFSHHPAIRGNVGSVQPTEYEMLRSSDTSGISGLTQKSSADSGKPRASRTSGFFRGSIVAEAPSIPQSVGPPASRMTDQHGLEDVFSSDPYAQPPLQTQSMLEEKQPKKKSGLRDAFSRRSSNAGKTDTSRDSTTMLSEARGKPPSNAQTVIYKVPEQGPHSSNLPKPQRAVSSAVEADVKKKRFSKLGSLFGRSNTIADEKPKSNKLTKTGSSRERPQRNTPSGGVDLMPSNSIVGSFRGYDAYEAAQRRDLPTHLESPPDVRSSRFPRPPSSNFDASRLDVQPPPEGWYGPASEQRHSTNIPQQFSAGPPPDSRRTMSSGLSRGRPLAQVPEAFRPVDASFNRPVEPIGPPEGHEPPFVHVPGSNVPLSESYLPGRQPSYQKHFLPGQGLGPTERLDAMIDPQRPRQMSHVSEQSQSSSGPVSGRSEYYPPGSRPFSSMPQVSPVRTREGSDGSVQSPSGVGSIGQNLGRIPQKDYPDQQTPWSVQVPQERRNSASSRVPSWAARAGGGPPIPEGYAYDPQQHREPPHSGERYPHPPRHGPVPPSGYIYNPDQPSYPNEGRYPLPPGAHPPRQAPIPWEEEPIGPGRRPFTAPPYSPEPPQGYNRRPAEEVLYDHLPMQAQYTQSPPPHAQPPPQQRRYFEPPQSEQPMSYPQQQRFPPPTYQHQPSQDRPVPYAQHPHPPPPPASRSVYDEPPIRQYRAEMEAPPPSTDHAAPRESRHASEDEPVVMRGVSYPGQEWMPEGLGKEVD